MESAVLGVDIGGTKIAFGLIAASGAPLLESRMATDISRGTTPLIDQIAGEIQRLIGQAPIPIAGIGIGCPGQVDGAAGIVRLAVNLDWRDVPLKAEIAQRVDMNLPISVENDVRAAAIGEMLFGAARGSKNFVYLAVGTGLGGAAVIDGSPLQGSSHFAMDIGHLALLKGGRLCPCGRRGCLETAVSGTGLTAAWREYRSAFPDSALAKMESASPGDILAAYQKNDPLAARIIEEASEALALAAVICGGVFNPDRIVIGGGLGLALSAYVIPKIEKTVRARLMPQVWENLQVVASQITSSAVGPAALIWQHSGE